MIEPLPLKQRLTSRRFWLTTIVILLVTFGEQFGVNLDKEELLALAGAVGLFNLKR